MKPLTRRVVVLILGLTILGQPSSRVAEAQPRKSNVLFIAVDDLRTEFGAYGSKYTNVENDTHAPLELERTRGMSYSLFNLNALLTVATIGEKVGVDLWSYKTQDERSFRRALEYLAPFVFGEKEWPHKQIIKWSPDEYYALLRKAAPKFNDAKFQTLLGKIPAPNAAERSLLLEGRAAKIDQN
jgi:Alginate lyase